MEISDKELEAIKREYFTKGLNAGVEDGRHYERFHGLAESLRGLDGLRQLDAVGLDPLG